MHSPVQMLTLLGNPIFYRHINYVLPFLMDHLQAYWWSAQIPYISDWMPLSLNMNQYCTQQPFLIWTCRTWLLIWHNHITALCYWLWSAVLTHISTALMQTTAVLKFLFGMIIYLLIYLLLLFAFCKSWLTTSCWSIWTKSRKITLLSSWMEVAHFYFKIKALVKHPVKQAV